MVNNNVETFDRDIKIRIPIANIVTETLSGILGNKNIPKEIKKTALNDIVEIILLFGS
jgi:hypothetical protein